MGLAVVLRDAFTGAVHQPEVVLCDGVTLFGGAVVPSDGFGVILWDATAVGVHDSEVPLRFNIALLGGFAKPGNSFSVILWDAATVGCTATDFLDSRVSVFTRPW